MTGADQRLRVDAGSLTYNQRDRRNGRGAGSQKSHRTGAGVGVNRKNGAIFSTGGVFFLLTSPLMGDPQSPPTENLLTMIDK